MFLAIGYALSALVRHASGATGRAVCVWLRPVVLYDLALLAAAYALPLCQTLLSYCFWPLCWMIAATPVRD